MTKTSDRIKKEKVREKRTRRKRSQVKVRGREGRKEGNTSYFINQ